MRPTGNPCPLWSVRGIGAEFASYFQALDQGQAEGSRLPGAGLGRAQNIATLESGWDGLCLDWGGSFVPLLGECAEERGCKTK
jgi:hypothetical protein